MPSAIAAADTTIGRLLTLGLHKGELRAAGWYGERFGRPQAGAADALVDEAAVPDLSQPAKDRWFDVLQQCGKYGGCCCICF